VYKVISCMLSLVKIMDILKQFSM